MEVGEFLGVYRLTQQNGDIVFGVPGFAVGLALDNWGFSKLAP
jgi:hypothetical protein